MRTAYYREPNGDYLYVFGPGSQRDLRECRAAAIEGLISSVCTTQASVVFLRECRKVKAGEVPIEWKSAIHGWGAARV